MVSNGPPAQPTPNIKIMMLTEVDTYLQAVSEADTADEAVALWRPGSAKPSQLKRLQQEPKLGKGHGGCRYSRPAPTVVNSGVHYQRY